MTLINQELPLDLSKLLNEWAIAAGRYLKSEQTGYIHYYYGETTQEKYDAIPILENILYCLALLRSRLIESIQEAKVLLKRLLVFQNQKNDELKGNFPIYLHEYPICQDGFLSLQLLTPFYWILKHFGHVLGELRVQIEQASQLALEYSEKVHQLQPFPYSMAVRLACTQIAFGILWEQSSRQEEGNQQLKKLALKQLEGCQSTKHLADLLVGLQMIYPSLLNSPWSRLWNFMQQTWHHSTGCYIGPCLREWQEREEPQPNLYDLYAGYFVGQFSRRATLLRPYHLHAVLIQPSIDKFHSSQSSFVEGDIKQQKWKIKQVSAWAYTALEKKEKISSPLDKTYTPFRLVWGDLHFVHSLVCQGGSYESVEYQTDDQSIQFIFHLPAKNSLEDEHKQREIEFFIDFHPEVQFTLGESIATIFELGQPLNFSLGALQASIIYELVEGEGNFLGHVMRGNRPSQIDNKGTKRFQAYDWTFFLRTIRRQGPCTIKVTFSYSNFNHF